MKKALLILPLYIISSLFCMAASENDLKTSIQQLQQAFLWIDHFYVDSVNSPALSEAAIKGMLKELDPHSTYLSPDEVRAMNENLGGNFEGIGVRYQMEEDTLLIINTVVGGPSEKVGVLAGDRIVTVNDTAIAGVKMTTKDIMRRLRGPKGSTVNIGIKRNAEPNLIHFNIIRDKIPVYSVDASYMAAPGVGYIKISRFGQTTYEEMTDAMKELKKKGMKNLILDLQDNGGGYLNIAVNMANEFLKANNLIVYTNGRATKREEYISKNNGSFLSGRVVVLIDEQSASASEIMSGAIQDLDRGVIIGRRSFGKGLVQRPVPLPGDAMIRLTVAHYYTPSGRCIQKPYKKGDRGDYDKDLVNRYNSGELVSADSIHFTDSLKYTTQNGRTVYGGGGIMPDVFVPLDTTKMTKTHRDIIAKGIYNKFVLNYFDNHQAALKKEYKNLDTFINRFEVTDTMLDELKKRAIKDSIKIDSTEFETSKSLIQLQIKAGLASDMFENGAYYRVINSINDIYRRGLEVIQDEELYNRLLAPKASADIPSADIPSANKQKETLSKKFDKLKNR